MLRKKQQIFLFVPPFMAFWGYISQKMSNEFAGARRQFGAVAPCPYSNHDMKRLHGV